MTWLRKAALLLLVLAACRKPASEPPAGPALPEIPVNPAPAAPILPAVPPAAAQQATARARIEAMGLPFNEAGLSEAVRRRKDDAIPLFAEAGMSLDAPLTPAGVTACLAAVHADAPVTLARLILAGADPARSGPNGVTPLHLAAEEGRVDCARVLLSNPELLKDYVKGSPLPRMFRWLNPAVDPASRGTARGQTPLMTVITTSQNRAILDLLLDARSPLEVRDADDRTALELAIMKGHLVFVDALLSRGADVNATDKVGRTPLMLAAAYGDAAIVTRLLKAGADVARRDREGRTALGLARQNNQLRAAETLTRAGAPEN